MGMRHLIAFFFVMMTISCAFAGSKSTKYFDMELLPAQPNVNEDLVIYVASKTDFTSENELELVGEFKLNGFPISAEVLSPKLWSMKVSAPTARGSYNLTAKLSIQDKLKSKNLAKRINEISREILSLKAQMVNSTDANVRAELQAQINDRKDLQNDLNVERATLPQLIGEDQFSFFIGVQVSANNLLELIRGGEKRHALIQNNDFGWDYYVLNPNELRNRANASYANQFGVNAQGLLDAHEITKNAYYFRGLENTAATLFALPIGVKAGPRAGRCTYLYAFDGVFLMNAGRVLGFPEFTDRGVLDANQFKVCMAAMHVVNTSDSTQAALDTVTEIDLNAVTKQQMAQRYRANLVAAGRNAGLRAFDFLSRFEEALLNNDRDLARSMAAVVAADATSIVPTTNYFLVGLGSTLEVLGEFVNEVPAYEAQIEAILSQLLPYQKEDGFFEYMLGASVGGGGVQDNAFILRGLLKVGGQEVAINKMLNGLKTYQKPHGGYFFYEHEMVEGQAELLSSLSRVARASNVSALVGKFLVEDEMPFEGIPMRNYHDRAYPDMTKLPFNFMFTSVEQ